MKQQQQGGTLIGFILGLVVGLAIAFVVAAYVTKIPVPLLNRSNTRPPGQDAAEAQRNKNWDPNAPLYSKNPARPPSTPEPTAPSPSDDPLGDLARQRMAATPSVTPPAPVALAPTSTALTPPGSSEAFGYFVQAGAFRSRQDAEAHRARLAMLGWQAQVSERDQNGRPVFRVRVGPFARSDDAESLKGKLAMDGMEAVLVRVQPR